MPADVETLRAVLTMADEFGLTLGSVKVGDIQLQVIGRLPRPEPSVPPGTSEQTDDPARAREKRLVELRKRSKEVFGFVKPDDVLMSLDGAL